MSNSIKWIFVLVGIAISFSTGKAIVHFNTLSHKQRILSGAGSFGLQSAQAKASSLFEVAVSRANLSGDGSSVTLDATVEALSVFGDAHYRWILPEGVSANGSVTGALGALKSGEQTSLHLSVVGSPEAMRRPIHLHVYRMVKGEAMGQMAQAEPKTHGHAEKSTGRIPASGTFMRVVE